MSPMPHGHVSSDLLGGAARHASLDGLREAERRHVEGCDQCRHLYAGYRLTDRLLTSGWRQTTLPAALLDQQPIRGGVRGLLGGLSLGSGARFLVPVALAACLVAVVGFGVLLPRLLPSPAPAATGSNTALLSPSPNVTLEATPDSAASASAEATPDASAGPTQSTGPSRTDSTGPGPVATPRPVATPGSDVSVKVAALSGWPIAWAPDGSHMLVARGSGWTNQRQIQIRDSAGGLTGSFNADHATWVDSHTIAAATQAGGGSVGKGPGGSSVTVRLLDLGGNLTATIPGQYSEGGPSSSGAILLGSGTGYLAIASQGGWGPSQSTYLIWDGQVLSSAHAGMPLAFSRDGKQLAVLHPSGGSAAASSQGWLEIVAMPSLDTIASLSHTNVRVASQGNGPGYAPDAAFSPDGGFLLVSGTLVDLSRGSATLVGAGGWLSDGTLLTSNSGAVLRWQGGHSTPDARFVAGGSVKTSLHGDVVEFFADNRPPLLLAADGTIGHLNLTGIASVDDASLAPDGGAVAVSGRGTDGSKVIGVAALP